MQHLQQSDAALTVARKRGRLCARRGRRHHARQREADGHGQRGEGDAAAPPSGPKRNCWLQGFSTHEQLLLRRPRHRRTRIIGHVAHAIDHDGRGGPRVVREGAAAASLLDVLAHLLLLGQGRLASLLLELLRRRGLRGAEQRREGALAGVHVVQPLREQAAVQGDLTRVGRGNLLQAPQERRRDLAGGGHRRRGQPRHELRHAGRGGQGRGDVALQAREDDLAFVDATHRIILRGRQAVRGRVDVVRYDHAGAPGVGLVQGTQGPQVALRLCEHPGPVKRALVKGVQPHTACAGDPLQLDQRSLDTIAVLVLPPAVALGRLLDDARARVEGQRATGRGALRSCASGREHLASHPADPLLGLVPPLVRVTRRPHGPADLGLRRRGVVDAEHEHGHERVQHLLGLRHTFDVLVRRQVEDIVSGLQARHSLHMHELFERRGKYSDVAEAEAVREAVAEQTMNRAMVLKHVGRGGAVPRCAFGVQAAHVPAVPVDEDAVQQVPDGRRVDLVLARARQGVESWPEHIGEQRDARLDRGAVVLSGDPLEVREEVPSNFAAVRQVEVLALAQERASAHRRDKGKEDVAEQQCGTRSACGTEAGSARDHGYGSAKARVAHRWIRSKE
mmetsp:Transcript_78504/g.240206  ORF Transcript_78504/g.240206 Transcript_78504/m.240206 type:complete len:620 (-) Transcript_78504:25-1884(-)